MPRKTSVKLWLFLMVGPLPVAGQGLPFHTPSALTMSFEERGVRAFSTVQSRGDVTGVVFPLVVLPFAPHERLTTTVKLPLTYKRMRDPGGASGGTYSEGGIGDLGLSAESTDWSDNRSADGLIHTGLPPRGGYLPSQWGECTRSNRFGKGTACSGAATPSSDVVVFLFRTATACAYRPALGC